MQRPKTPIAAPVVCLKAYAIHTLPDPLHPLRLCLLDNLFSTRFAHSCWAGLLFAGLLFAGLLFAGLLFAGLLFVEFFVPELLLHLFSMEVITPNNGRQALGYPG
jgi:hypothetical protein